MKIVWNSSSWEMYLLLSVWVHGHLSNGLCYNSVLHFLFWCSACSGFGSSFGCFLCPFDTPANRGMFFCLLICFLSSFFLSDTKRCSRLIFYISCPSLRISCFLRSPPSVFYLLFVRVYKASVFWQPLCLALDTVLFSDLTATPQISTEAMSLCCYGNFVLPQSPLGKELLKDTGLIFSTLQGLGQCVPCSRYSASVYKMLNRSSWVLGRKLSLFLTYRLSLLSS